MAVTSGLLAATSIGGGGGVLRQWRWRARQLRSTVVRARDSREPPIWRRSTIVGRRRRNQRRRSTVAQEEEEETRGKRRTRPGKHSSDRRRQWRFPSLLSLSSSRRYSRLLLVIRNLHRSRRSLPSRNRRSRNSTFSLSNRNRNSSCSNNNSNRSSSSSSCSSSPTVRRLLLTVPSGQTSIRTLKKSSSK